MANKLRLGRRDALTMVTGAAIAAGAPAQAAEIALSCWTGYPELVPWYKERGDAYAKDHAGFSLNVLSTTLREHEQKLAAAMPTGTGPDLFDVGLILSVNFIEAGLIKSNPPDIDKQFKSGAYAKVSLDQFTVDGKTYGLPNSVLLPSAVLEQSLFPRGRLGQGAGDVPGGNGIREEAGEGRQHWQDDAERHQPAPVRPGQRHR